MAPLRKKTQGKKKSYNARKFSKNKKRKQNKRMNKELVNLFGSLRMTSNIQIPSVSVDTLSVSFVEKTVLDDGT